MSAVFPSRRLPRWRAKTPLHGSGKSLSAAGGRRLTPPTEQSLKVMSYTASALRRSARSSPEARPTWALGLLLLRLRRSLPQPPTLAKLKPHTAAPRMTPLPQRLTPLWLLQPPLLPQLLRLLQKANGMPGGRRQACRL